MIKLATKEDAERQPPHSLEMEQAVLGCVFIAPRLLPELGPLKVDDFFIPVHREIYDAMLEVERRGRPIDPLTVGDELKAKGMFGRLEGGLSYLNALADAVPTPENLRHYIGVVATRAIQRRVIAAAGLAMSRAYGDVHDCEDFLSDVRQQFASIENGADQRPVRVGDVIDTIVDSIENRAERPGDYFVTTGFRVFQDKIGGLRGGNLIVVATNPGKGKSAWMLDVLMHNAEIGVPSLVFSYEMSLEENIERMLAKKASVNGRRVATGRMTGPEWQRIHGAVRAIRDLPIYVDTRHHKIGRICSEYRRWRSKQKAPKAIGAVDYLGLIETQDDGEHRNDEIGRMTRGLKKLATDTGDPILLLAQLNRKNVSEGRKPMISDLRDSGCIEQDANTVIFPWWDGVPPLTGKHPASLIVGKNRGGAVGEVDLEWEAEFVRFSDPGDYEPLQGSLIQ